MTNWASVALGLLILVTMLLPVAFLIFAASVMSGKLRGTPSKLLVVGAVVLAIASLDSTFNYFGAYLLEARSMVNIMVYSGFIFEALNLVALILIGTGLIKLSRTISSKEVPE